MGIRVCVEKPCLQSKIMKKMTPVAPTPAAMLDGWIIELQGQKLVVVLLMVLMLVLTDIVKVVFMYRKGLWLRSSLATVAL